MPNLTFPHAAVVTALALACAAAVANDRPFQSARTAVMENDDEQTWSFESWLQRYGPVRGLSFEPEYSFTSQTSLQAELTRYVDRRDRETGHEAELEFKHLFNDIARDGWGWGVSATLATGRTAEAGSSTGVELKVPMSFALIDGRAYLHVNAGIEKAIDEKRRFTASLGLQHEVVRRTVLFAELARDAERGFAQAGVRQWIKREKFAVDFTLQQQRTGGQRSSGFILGFGWYDL